MPTTGGTQIWTKGGQVRHVVVGDHPHQRRASAPATVDTDPGGGAADPPVGAPDLAPGCRCQAVATHHHRHHGSLPPQAASPARGRWGCCPGRGEEGPVAGIGAAAVDRCRRKPCHPRAAAGDAVRAMKRRDPRRQSPPGRPDPCRRCRERSPAEETRATAAAHQGARPRGNANLKHN